MKRWLMIIVLAVLIVGAFFIWRGRSKAEAAQPYRVAVVDRGAVKTAVTSTGTVSAVTTVQVGTQVSGTIKNLYVDFNSPVHKGQIIARLDPTSLQTAVNQAQASLNQAKATLAQVTLNLSRTKALYDKQLAPQSDYDNAETAVEIAQANTESAQADLDRAKVNLNYSVIASPTDGTVISRNVDIGQTVAASLQAPTLFTIAQDLRVMQIEADIDEADIGGLKEGMDATFTVDAFPDETFHGKIQQIRYNASTTQGVVTYPVIISVSNPDLLLRPGMTANVTIVTAERDDVLRVPSIALRFRPPDAPAQASDQRAAGDSSHAQGSSQQGMHRGGHGSGPGQKRDSTAQGTAPAKHVRKSTLWVKGSNGKAQSRLVTVGLNDGNHVEITGGDLAAGDSVIVGMTGASAAASAANSNRMPGFGGGRH